MFPIFLVDDEPQDLAGLKSLLVDFFPELEICGTATNIDVDVQGILLTRPQLVLLDIEIGSASAFDLLKKFEDVFFQIVFVTAHSEYTIRAFEVSALDI